MDYSVRHNDFLEAGFEGDCVIGYKKGDIAIDIYEDEDRYDLFLAFEGDERKGWIKTTGDLQKLTEKYNR